jgi:hypothetical protein
MRDRMMPRASVVSIGISTFFGATTVTIADGDGRVVRVMPSISQRRVVRDLRERGYPLS